MSPSPYYLGLCLVLKDSRMDLGASSIHFKSSILISIHNFLMIVKNGVLIFVAFGMSCFGSQSRIENFSVKAVTGSVFLFVMNVLAYN